MDTFNNEEINYGLVFKYSSSNLGEVNIYLVDGEYLEYQCSHFSPVVRMVKISIPFLDVANNGELLLNNLQILLDNITICDYCDKQSLCYKALDKNCCEDCFSRLASNPDIKDECAICKDEIGINHKTLKCGHTFHYLCVKKWNKNCPICRGPI